MYPAVLVDKFVKQVVREGCPSTTGPPLPTMTDSVLSHQICLSQKCLSRIGLPLLPVPTTGRAPRAGSTFNFSASHKGFYFEKC